MRWLKNNFTCLTSMIRRLTRVFLVSHLAQHVRNTYTCTLKVELLLTNDSNLVQLLAANRHFRLISVPPAPCAIVYKLVYRKFSNLNRLTWRHSDTRVISGSGHSAATGKLQGTEGMHAPVWSGNTVRGDQCKMVRIFEHLVLILWVTSSVRGTHI